MKKSTLKRLTNYTNDLETILEDFEDVVSDIEDWLYNNEGQLLRVQDSQLAAN